MTGNEISNDVHVLVSLDFPESFLNRVSAVDPRVVLHYVPGVRSNADVSVDVLRRTEVLYTGDFLPGPGVAPSLAWVQLDTSGIDHVRDTEVWTSEVQITTLGGVSPAPLAEWVLMMVLAHAHHLKVTERLASRRYWPTRDERWDGLMPHNLRTSTLGIVGYGRIGHEIARLATAFGMRVIAARQNPGNTRPDTFGEEPNIAGVTELPVARLPELLAVSDYLVLAVPLTPGTKGLIGGAELAGLKPGCSVINASRGGVVDEVALLAALDSGHLDFVASDVFEEEPLPTNSPFWTKDRMIVTPHVAGFAPDYVESVGNLFTENLRRYLDRRPLLNLADRTRGY